LKLPGAGMTLSRSTTQGRGGCDPRKNFRGRNCGNQNDI
jgi:hypothetical protein